MKFSFKTLSYIAFGMFVSSSALAQGCGVAGGNVRILANDFPALHALVSEAEKCQGYFTKVTKNHTKENRNLQVPALSSNPAQYTTAVVANSSLVALMNDGLVRPLNSLVERYGGNINKSQLITINGDIMAIAFMANAQHLFYRKDILQDNGISTPETYDDVIAAAKKLRDSGVMEYPYIAPFKSGWNLAEEFVNVYMSTGSDFFKKGSARPSINNNDGVRVLKTLKKLSEYMNPDYLTFDSNAVQAEWEAGNAALSVLWGSRASAVLDDNSDDPSVPGNTAFASAPSLSGSNIPASTLWWDGFTVAKNIPDEDAEATFRAMVYGASTKMALANPDKASWLIKGAKATKSSTGVIATARNGAKPYPMLPYMGLMHSAIGNEVAAYLQGNQNERSTLMNIEAAYVASAREKGFL